MRDRTEHQARSVLFLTDFNSPPAIWAKLAGWLAKGSQHPKHGFHWPTVATVDAAGQADARIVVLRHFDSTRRTLSFHTDIRSTKVQQLREHPRAVLLFHDSQARLQLRCNTSVLIHHQDEVTRAAFDQLSPFTQASYSSAAPGVLEPLDAPFRYPPQPPFDATVAYTNFAVVQCQIQEVDALELHSQGHRRAKLTWNADEVQLTRVSP